MYTIEFAAAVAEDLTELRAHHRQRDEAERRVTVRAIRHKPPHKTTEEIL
jgi:hypothetical protein